MLRQAGAAESVAAEEGGHSAAARCLAGQREMPESLDPPQRERYAHEYIALRPRLEAHFRKRFPTLRGQESDFYNEAWESLLRSEARPDSLFAYLDRALYTRGLNELRRRQRRPGDQPHAGEPGVLETEAERTEREPQEIVIDDVSAASTQQLLLDRLSSRQARIIKLHYGWGLTIGEAAAALSLSKRTVRREVEDAAPKITENAEWLTPCAEGGRRSLVRAYVLGFLSTGRAAKAAAHLETCAGCRALREQMEEALRGVAAVVPAAVVAEPPGSDRSMLERIAHAAEAGREQVADVVGTAKTQAAAALTRPPAADATSQVAAGGGLRGSGAMFATAASCLVVGGGTVTYCAVEGVPEPVRSVIPGAKADDDQTQANEKSPADPTPVASQPEPPASSVAPPAAAPAPAAPQPAPAPEPESSPAEEEFGIEETSSTEPSASSAQSAPQPTPAPAPSGGGEEFGFER